MTPFFNITKYYTPLSVKYFIITHLSKINIMELLFGNRENRLKNVIISLAIVCLACLSALWINLGS